MIRIGYDAKRIVMNDTGIGNYGRLLVQALADHAPEAQLLLSAPENGKMGLYTDLLEHDNVEMLLPPRCIWRHLPYYQSYWRNRGSLPQLRGRFMDLYHGVAGELPGDVSSLDVPAVLTMHDVVYEIFPSFYSKLDVKIYKYIHSRSLKDADHVIAVSENTKSDLMELYNIPSHDITVSNPGCSAAFRQHLTPFQVNKVTGQYLLPAEYILCVGTLEKRKNAGLIVKALSLLKDHYIPLVLVGRQTPYVREIKHLAKALGVQHRVIFLEGVPSQDLPALYQGASVFVFPSLYEGFGIPILEALCSRIPVIAARGSSMEEAGGPGSLYCDPNDPSTLATMLEEVLSSPSLSRQMVQSGLSWSEQFRPEHLAAKVMSIYRSVIS